MARYTYTLPDIDKVIEDTVEETLNDTTTYLDYDSIHTFVEKLKKAFNIKTPTDDNP